MADTDPLLDFAIDLDDVRERIKGMGYFLSVEDVESASIAIQEENARTPAAYVSIASESGQEIRSTVGHSSRVAVTLSVLFSQQAALATGETRDAIETTRKSLIRMLYGWTPKGAEKALEYDRYLIRGYGVGVIWAEVLFRTSYRLSTV